MKTAICLLFWAAAMAASTHGQNMNTKDQALELALEKFAAEHGLSGREMTAMLTKYLFDQPLLSKKANIGIIDTAVHVDLAAPVNRLLLESGKRIWEGKTRETVEIVALVRQGLVIRPLVDGDAVARGILLVRFSPEKVQVIDPESGEGGFYDRATAQPANAQK